MWGCASALFSQVANKRTRLGGETALAVFLCEVQSLVGALLQAFQRIAGRALGDAHADRRHHAAIPSELAGGVLDGAADGAKTSFRLRQREAGRHDDELVAAETRDEVVSAQRAYERFRNHDENPVADGVPVA